MLYRIVRVKDNKFILDTPDYSFIDGFRTLARMNGTLNEWQFKVNDGQGNGWPLLNDNR